MIRTLIRLALILVVGVVGYNFFYGTPAEKANSKEIVNDVKDSGKKIFKSVGSLLKSEKQKFDNGKYDEAMGGLKNVFGDLKKRASTEGAGFKKELNDLDLRREKLSDDIKDAEGKKEGKKTIKELKEEFSKISEAAKILIEKANN